MKTTITIDTVRETVRISTVAHFSEGEDPRSMVDAILRDALGEHRR